MQETNARHVHERQRLEADFARSTTQQAETEQQCTALRAELQDVQAKLASQEVRGCGCGCVSR